MQTGASGAHLVFHTVCLTGDSLHLLPYSLGKGLEQQTLPDVMN